MGNKDLFSEITSKAILSRALYVAADLSIADHLSDFPLSLNKLAELTNSHGPSLERLMAYLISNDFFIKNEDFYSNNQLSELMTSKHPQSVRLLLLRHDKFRWNAFGELGYSIKTGLPSFNHLYGCDYFTHLENFPEQSQLFDAAMQAISEEEDITIAKTLSLKGVVVDLGGGKGQLLNKILDNQPSLTKAILFDLPQVVSRNDFKDERFAVYPGNFFTEMNIKADYYILKRVLHDWNDFKANIILKNISSKMSEHSRLIIIEAIVDKSTNLKQTLDYDLRLFTVFGGKERTFRQFQELAKSNGLEIVRDEHIAKSMHIIECQKI